MERACFQAVSTGRPVLLFVFHSDEEADGGKFRALLANASPGSKVKHIKSVDPCAFAMEYLIALYGVLQVHAIPGPRAIAECPVVENHIRNRFFHRLLHRMEHWPVVYRRYEQNADLKEAAANFFLDLYLSPMVNAPVSRIFFESGSSIAFLSEAFIARLEEEWLRMSANASIETNNILTYIDMVLAQFLPVTLFPPGPPEKKYGATFGPLASVDVRARGVHPIEGLARHMTDRIRDHFAEGYSESGVIFSATSGIELSRGSAGFGPHVGSYHNMLFKRAILESGCPVVLFLDQDKLPRPFIAGRCYAVCDEDFPWDYACDNKPIALACAFHNEESAKPAMEDLRSLGFDFEPERRSERPWCFIATNSCFQEVSEKWKSKAQSGFLGSGAERTWTADAVKVRRSMGV